MYRNPIIAFAELN